MRRQFLIFSLLVSSSLVCANEAFVTTDPLKAFMYEEYPLGSDYFIHGKKNTILFRCVADFNQDGRLDIAISEKSIWGNRTGPLEIFVLEESDKYTYLHTVDYEYETRLKAICGSKIESCSSDKYLSFGECNWKKGF